MAHRTANVNESSTRYAPAIDSAQKVTEWRLQATDNKQGSKGVLTFWPDPTEWDHEDKFDLWPEGPADYLSERESEAQNFAREVYEERLAFGIAREQARKDLPLSTYTTAYWKMDLHNLLNFLRLRLDSHAQKEIREFANAIAEIVKVWVPWTWEAFEDYVLESVTFSRMEMEGLRTLIQTLMKPLSTDSELTSEQLAEVKKTTEGLLEDPEFTVVSNAPVIMVPAVLTRPAAIETAVKGSGLKNREKKELVAKLGKLLGEE